MSHTLHHQPSSNRRLTLHKLLLIALLVASATGAHAEDPIRSDGDKYKLRFENDRVRVLEYRDLAGDKTHQHDHPAFVLYAVSPFKRKIILPDGKVLIREFKAGDTMWSAAQTHIGENIGDTPTHVIMIELK
jgi:beta-alanine degradation protein BauB